MASLKLAIGQKEKSLSKQKTPKESQISQVEKNSQPETIIKTRTALQKFKRDSRCEYLTSFLILLVFEQFVFHQWQVWDFYKAREFDLGVYEKSNIPITRHNHKLFTMYRTEINMSDFQQFIQVDVSDVIRDKKKAKKNITQYDIDNFNQLSKISNETVFSKVQFRHYLTKYLPERILWTGIHPIYNDTRERDTHRYYWSAKMAKDFIIFTGKEEFKYSEVQDYFQDRIILNYLNELLLEASSVFEEMLISKAGIKQAFFDEHIPYWSRQIPNLKKAKRMVKFINMDNIYYQFAEMINTNSSINFRENLSNYSDFSTNKLYYKSILNHSNYTLDWFRSPEDPYLIWEETFDNMTSRLDRLIRRSYLSQDLGQADQTLKHVYFQQDINNTMIMRGFHIIVRAWNGSIINDEYGMTGPFEDSPKQNGKILWYRPHDYLDPEYELNEEFLPTYAIPRKRFYRYEDFDDKRSVLFQRIKKSNFLPRCIKEVLITKDYLTHYQERCPHDAQEPVFDDFYKILGIEKNKNYIFEFMNVW